VLDEMARWLDVLKLKLVVAKNNNLEVVCHFEFKTFLLNWSSKTNIHATAKLFLL